MSIDELDEDNNTTTLDFNTIAPDLNVKSIALSPADAIPGDTITITVKAENLHITNLKCPATGSVESQEDLEGAVLEKAYLCEKALQLTDNLFKQFITLRLSDDWNKRVVPRMKKWMSS